MFHNVDTRSPVFPFLLFHIRKVLTYNCEIFGDNCRYTNVCSNPYASEFSNLVGSEVVDVFINQPIARHHSR
jgi:hypothetical protein